MSEYRDFIDASDPSSKRPVACCLWQLDWQGKPTEERQLFCNPECARLGTIRVPYSEFAIGVSAFDGPAGCMYCGSPIRDSREEETRRPKGTENRKAIDKSAARDSLARVQPRKIIKPEEGESPE